MSSEFAAIPKEHNVVKSIYSNNPLTSPYGTTAFLKILQTPSPLPELNEFLQKKTQEFLFLQEQIYHVRKQRFSKLVEDLQMCDDYEEDEEEEEEDDDDEEEDEDDEDDDEEEDEEDEDDEDDDEEEYRIGKKMKKDDELDRIIQPSKKIRNYLLWRIWLNPWISPETFRYFDTNWNFRRFFRADPDDDGFNRIIEDLVKEIDRIEDKKIKKDFLLNWGYFPNYFVNEAGSGWKDFDIYSDNKYSKELKKLMDEVVDKIQEAYRIAPDSFKEEGMCRIIPEGFILYRAFEKTKDMWGDLQNGMWAAVNGSDITSLYITPQLEYNEEFKEFENKSKYYCEKMRDLAVFRVNRDLTLLDFSNEETKDFIYDKMMESDEKLASIFKEVYMDERNSFKPDDQKVATWLCENGYDGYLGEMYLDWFHDEVMICNQRQNLSLVEVYNGNDIGIPICEEPYKKYNFVLELF